MGPHSSFPVLWLSPLPSPEQKNAAEKESKVTAEQMAKIMAFWGTDKEQGWGKSSLRTRIRRLREFGRLDELRGCGN